MAADHALPEPGPGSRRRYRGQSRAPGFSLVELVIVLLLLGIVGALALPRLRGTELDEALFTGAIADTLHAARQRATAARCEVRVDVSATGIAVRQRNALCSGPFDRVATALGSSGESLDRTAPGALTITATRQTFYFEPDGRVSALPGGPALDVTLQAGARRLELAGATGHVATQ